jgi:hypothetical protein
MEVLVMVELNVLPAEFRTPGMPQPIPNTVGRAWITSGWYLYPVHVYYP